MQTLFSNSTSVPLRCLSIMLVSVVVIVGDVWCEQALAQSVDEQDPESQTYTIDGRYFSTETLEGEQALIMF